MSDQHTPLPWAVDPDRREGYRWNAHVVQANDRDRRVCFMTSDGPSEANAALIVRSVNALPALVKALEEIASTPTSKSPEYDKFCETSGGHSYGPGWAAWHFQQIARAALASVRGAE